MRPAIDAVRETGTAVAEVAMSYTGDLSDPGREPLHPGLLPASWPSRSSTPARTCWRSRTWPGCCGRRPPRRWSSALRSRFDLPVHVHTHDTPGGQLATYLAAWQAGADAVDGAAAPLAGTTSQPALSSIVAAAAHTEYDTGLSLARGVRPGAVLGGAAKGVRALRSRGSVRRPTGRVYHHEIPGGQLSNLRQQAIALGLGDRFEEIEEHYAAADRILGRLVKVTPSSKVVGDLALALVGAGVTRRRVRRRPGPLRHPRLGDRFPARRTGRPARRLAGTVAHQGAGRPCRRPSRPQELSRRGRGGARASRAEASGRR